MTDPKVSDLTFPPARARQYKLERVGPYFGVKLLRFFFGFYSFFTNFSVSALFFRLTFETLKVADLNLLILKKDIPF